MLNNTQYNLKRYSILFISFFIINCIYCINIVYSKEGAPTADSNQIASKEENLKENGSHYKGIYNVRKHDTLWDISGKTLKSPERWPALWGKNPHIRNPHWIYPGDTIYLNDQKSSYNSNQSNSLPPAIAPSDNVINLEEINPPYYYFYPLMESVGYLKESAVHPIGKIISCMPKYQKEIDIDNGVYLQIEDETDLMVGDQFQILRTFYIRSKNTTASSIMVHHYITGVVEITKLKAKPCKCHDQVSQIEGRIVKAYRTILSDDILIPYNSIDSKILVRKSNNNVNAKIIFSEDHSNRISENAVVFINKGRDDGLQAGQFYDIFNQPKGVLLDSDRFIEKTEHIGSLVILRLEDKTSSALITYAYKEIAPGDIMVSPRSDTAFSNIKLMGDYR